MKRLAVLLLLVSTAMSATAQAREPAAEEADTTISGRGFGHGRGMSQYGAQGAALAGRTLDQILDFYYPGTTTGKAAGSVRIRITRDTTDGVRVLAAGRLRVRDLKANKSYLLPTASNRNQWSIDPYGDHGTRISSFDSKKRVWTAWRRFAGMAQFEGRSVLYLVMPNGRSTSYRGALRAIDVKGKHLDTVNVVPLELYLRGVVPREAVTSWRPAALQAQAVAARTYSVYHRNRRAAKPYDLCDTVACQVYGGFGAEKPSTNAAIKATAGQIRLHRGKPIIAEFSSSNGGATAASVLPYQLLKVDGWDAYPGNGNPNVSWRVKRTAAQVRATFGVGTISRLRVVRRTGVGPAGGRVVSVEAVGSKGRVTLSGDKVRSRLRLRSAWFSFTS